MLHYQHTSFLSSNQATELTCLGSLAEPSSKDDIIFKHPRSCMHRQTDTTHRPYISIKKKETPPYLWDQGNLLSVLHTDTSLEDTYLSRIFERDSRWSFDELR